MPQKALKLAGLMFRFGLGIHGIGFQDFALGFLFLVTSLSLSLVLYNRTYCQGRGFEPTQKEKVSRPAATGITKP